MYSQGARRLGNLPLNPPLITLMHSSRPLPVRQNNPSRPTPLIASIAALGVALSTASATIVFDIRASSVDAIGGSVDPSGKLVTLDGFNTGNVTLQIWAQVANAAPTNNIFGVQTIMGSIKSSVGVDGALLTGTMAPAVFAPVFNSVATAGTLAELTVPPDGSIDLGSNATGPNVGFIKPRKDPTTGGETVPGGTIFYVTNNQPLGSTVNPITNGYEFLMGTATFSIQSFANPSGSFSLRWAIPSFVSSIVRAQIAGWTDGDGINNTGNNQFSEMSVGSAVNFVLGAVSNNSIWIATGGGSFGSAANWNPGIPNASDNANFGSAIQAPSTVTLDGNRSVKSVAFSSVNAYTISQGTGGALSVEEGFTVPNGSHNVSAPVLLPNASTVSILNAVDSLTLSGAVGGAGGITKIGPGKLLLTGANTFAGATTVNAGTLEVNTTGANAIAGNVAIAGGTLRLLQSEQIANASSVNVTSGTFDLGANSETVASVQITGGAITGTGTLTSASAFDVRAGTVVARLGGSVGLNKTTADTVTLSGANTYTGLTQVNAGVLQLTTAAGNAVAGDILVRSGGTLRVASGGNMIADTSTVTVSGGTLEKLGSTETVGALRLLGGSIVGTGAWASIAPFDLQNGTVSSRLAGSSGLNKTTSGTVILTGLNSYTGTTTVSAGILQGSSDSLHGDIVNNATLTFDQDTNSSSITFAGNITGSGALVKIGANELELTGTNSYQGGTTISAGRIGLQNATALPLGRPVHIAAGGALSYFAVPAPQPIGTLTGEGFVFLNSNAALTIGADDGTGTFAGTIDGGPATVIKTGAGTQTLSGFNNYRGPTSVNGGRLILTGNWSATGYTAESGGILKFDALALTLGAGSIRANAGGAIEYGNVTVNGGFLRGPGVHTVLPGATVNLNGVTSFNSTTLAQNGGANLTNVANGGQITNGAVLNWDGGANSSSGRLTVNNTVNLRDWTNDGVVTINTGGILNNTGSDLVSGGGSRFTVLPGGQVNVQTDYALSLQASLLVNNGTINGATTINYGATAKGAGVFGPVTVLDGGRFSPGNSAGTATLNGAYTLGAGGGMDLEIFDALGTAGATTGWDLVRLLGPDGLLDVQSGNTANSRFLIHLASTNAGALNFNNASIYDWQIVDTAQGITGLDPGDIGIDASSFLNPLDGGTFSVAERSGDLYLHYQPVPEPSILALFASCLGLLGRRSRRPFGPAK